MITAVVGGLWLKSREHRTEEGWDDRLVSPWIDCQRSYWSKFEALATSGHHYCGSAVSLSLVRDKVGKG